MGLRGMHLTLVGAVALLSGTSACSGTADVGTPTPASLAAVAPTVTATSPAPLTVDPDRLAATIGVDGPSRMAVGIGYVWVITGRSITRIDPHTYEVVGGPIPVAAGAEAIAFGEGSLW
jgi:hypothetical protein